MQPSPQDTFAALLTPRGRGAVATIRLKGNCRLIDQPSLFRAANRKPLAEQPIGRIVFGRWGETVREEIVLCRIDEETMELHCHGGETAAGRILNDLQSAGWTIQSWPEMVGELDGPFESECLQALTRATTLRTADFLLQQQSGLLRDELEALHNSLRLSISPSLQHEGATERHRNGETKETLQARLDNLLRWSDFGLHLTQPWRVVLAGRPNVGKSSLINALVGYSRSIVYEQPGTTRDVVTAETALDGWPVQFADTAGIRNALDSSGDREEEAGDAALETAGIELSRRLLAGADCRLLLIDTSRPPHEDDRRLLADWPEALVVAHKCDLPDVWGDHVPKEAVRVSSVTGKGLADLVQELVCRLVPEVPPFGTAIPVTERQVRLLRAARDALQQNDRPAAHAALERLLPSISSGR